MLAQHVVGIPLNLLIAVFIQCRMFVVDTQFALNQKHCVVCLGESFSNVSVLFQNPVDFYVHLLFRKVRRQRICFNFVAGLSFASLALYVFLSLIDQYFCIAQCVLQTQPYHHMDSFRVLICLKSFRFQQGVHHHSRSSSSVTYSEKETCPVRF